MARRLLLIGWDAADWRVIQPLMDAGRMPALQGLVERGVMGNLATLHPVLSPMIWTSIATGKRPHKHGVLGFTEPAPDGAGARPVTVLSRRTRAVWNILHQQGLRSNVVAWWPSHPAEPIRGAMVSNHYARATGAFERGWPLPPGTVHPPELAETLAELRFHPQELSREHVLPFVPKAGEIDQEKDRRLAALARTIAECTSVQAAATWLMAETEWDFTAVYFDAIDHFCHAFMRYHPPRQAHVSERDFELYSGVVEAGYRYHDLMLHRLLQLAGPDTAVILVSDHGFHPDHQRPLRIPREPAGPAAEHRDLGVLAMAGPGLARDELVHGASVLDVTPTILALFGLPVGDDMDGRPIAEAFAVPPRVRTIPSWDEVGGDAGTHPPELRLDPLQEREALRQLVELGYVEAPEEDAEKAAAQAAREQRYNLARAYMDADLHAEAVPLLRELHDAEPGVNRFGVQLALCLRALEQVGHLRELVEEMDSAQSLRAGHARERLAELEALARERSRAQKAEGPAPASGREPARPREPLLGPAERREWRQRRDELRPQHYALDFLRGWVAAADGDHAAALAALRRAEEADPERPGLPLEIGGTYLALGRFEEARRSFARAIEIDSENPHAQLGMARACLGLRRNRRAARHALRAVELRYRYPFAHYCLGVALHRLGRIDRAVQALEVALAQNPNFAEAHRRLALLYRRRIPDRERAEAHLRRAREIERGGGGRAPAICAAAGEAPPGSRPTAPLLPPTRSDADPGCVVTLVSGLPRSGTSMLMQMLAAGGLEVLADDARPPDAHNERGYFELDAVRGLARDASFLDGAAGKVVKIVAPLLQALPRERAYRVVFVERELAEVVASQRRMLEAQGRRGASLSDEQLRAVFARQLRRVKRVLALRRIPTLFLEHRAVLEDPKQAAGGLAGFLGNLTDPDAAAAAVEPRLHRERAVRAAGGAS